MQFGVRHEAQCVVERQGEIVDALIPQFRTPLETEVNAQHLLARSCARLIQEGGCNVNPGDLVSASGKLDSVPSVPTSDIQNPRWRYQTHQSFYCIDLRG